MKVLIFAMFTMIITTTFAQSYDSCLKLAKRTYLKQATPSDTQRTFELKELLLAGTALSDAGNTLVDGFEEDMLIYVATGSYHSGYFRDVVVINPKNCSFYKYYNSYSE